MRMVAALFLLTGLALWTTSPCVAAQTLTSVPADTLVMVDGNGSDPAWGKAPALVVHDKVADVDITLKSVHKDGLIFFLASYPDPEENRTHKPWVWNKDLEVYELGPQREDTFAFKWNLEGHPVDLSNFADNSYRADVWYWKANRTDPVGFADDKHHVLSPESAPKATRITSRSGKPMFLQRLGDAGKSTTSKQILTSYKGDLQPQYVIRKPEGSRADVRAKGTWKNGVWTIEFARRLDTGHDDDIQFRQGGSFLFGVSVYGLYGKPIDKSKAHLYGQGRISDPLTLEIR
ncbi:MAG: hypothetical protein D6751_00900 [Deltaproteobacteria bacterium]|nr:MAG: hypothetical protein D6751_00900 [Deltaproteobacteria bacterium]